jgi:hypothetical protein
MTPHCIRIGKGCVYCEIYGRCDHIPIPKPPPAEKVAPKPKPKPPPSLFEDERP